MMCARTWERRWRAAQRAGMHTIPVIVRELNDQEMLELAIIENVQRSDLNAIEEASGYHDLMDRFNYTQERLAEVIGKSRSHVANTLRLLKLPDTVRTLVRGGQLTAGHARALVGRELFVHFPEGMGQSKLKVPFADVGTGRNLNTVRALIEMASAKA